MPDATELAHEAIIKATEALTRVASHELECARRYQESAAQNARQHLENVSHIEKLDEKVDALLAQSDQAKGRAEVNTRLFGTLPSTIWTIIITGLITLSGSALTVFWLRIIEPIKTTTGH